MRANRTKQTCDSDSAHKVRGGYLEKFFGNTDIWCFRGKNPDLGLKWPFSENWPEMANFCKSCRKNGMARFVLKNWSRFVIE